MRNITARGIKIPIDPNNIEWITGNLIQSDDEIYIATSMLHDHEVEDSENGFATEVAMYKVDPNTVGMFVGEYDKSSDSIPLFEGDVIEFVEKIDTDNGVFEKKCIGVISYDEDNCCVDVSNRICLSASDAIRNCKLIGNIYNTLELKVYE